ncbi:ScbA/BarX family gamma-butyrolactone biosynthesis protein [Streptomyces ferrugineus]|uniref:ScbA/BarX family gamma-butyrolactone biosynthesis protein n=1 Tax=Streptomyces ferrugineus TaxID=1413221 RepID=UPI001D14CE2E|nr:ScbA/BarX family gamma-butyrolactone biosynthesis protein [Streptomyces ferrugineus]
MRSLDASARDEQTAGPAGPAPATAGWHTEISGEHVHRPDARDAFPTAWRRLDDTRFQVRARWPRRHRFFTEVAGRFQDPLLIPEILRQGSMLLAHAAFAVPIGDRFVMQRIRYSAAPAGLVLDRSSEDAVADFTCGDVRRRGRRLAGMRCAMVLRRQGRVVATADGRLDCVTDRAYRRLRGERLSLTGCSVPLLPALPPGAVGRRDTAAVVLAPSPRPGAWQLRVNTAHPTLFRRPNDHVPGFVLLEAARQAATAFSLFPGLMVVTDMDMVFARYAELDSPCWIEADPLPKDDPDPATVQVRGLQDDAEVFSCTVTAAASGPVDR